jgi:Zn-dependent peptidase ImmA (M78 family)/DNA-binding XRE family transcriptional regulator
MLNPSRIDLVRRRLGLTKMGFSKALGIDRKTLQRFENGSAELNEEAISALRKLSGFPLKFFYKGDFDYPNADSVSFRSLRSLTASPRDAALAAGAIAFELDDWISRRFNLPEHDLPQISNKSPREAAAQLRAFWGIGSRPIANMINLLESHGVRVFSLVEETRHLDAYSFWRNDKPYVFLNTVKTAEHSRYDGAHELGHLVMHRHTGSGHKSAEDEANAFASVFLMPPADLLAEMPVVRSLNDLIQGKRRWRVSVAALNYALHKVGVISDWNYRGFYIELGKLGRTTEPNGIQAETSQVWAKILTSLWSDGLPLSRIADDLSVPEHHLASLLFGIAAPLGMPQAQLSRQTLRVV